MSVKSFDVAKDIIKEATSQFSVSFNLNEDNLKIFKQYCEYVDKFIEEFDAKSLEFSVDEITTCVKFGIEVSDLIIEDITHYFWQIVARCVSCSFEQISDTRIIVSFVFPSLWEHI